MPIFAFPRKPNTNKSLQPDRPNPACSNQTSPPRSLVGDPLPTQRLGLHLLDAAGVSRRVPAPAGRRGNPHPGPAAAIEDLEEPPHRRAPAGPGGDRPRLGRQSGPGAAADGGQRPTRQWAAKRQSRALSGGGGRAAESPAAAGVAALAAAGAGRPAAAGDLPHPGADRFRRGPQGGPGQRRDRSPGSVDRRQKTGALRRAGPRPDRGRLGRSPGRGCRRPRSIGTRRSEPWSTCSPRGRRRRGWWCAAGAARAWTRWSPPAGCRPRGCGT